MRDLASTVRPASADAAPFSADYEYRVFTLPRGTSRAESRQLLTEQAEYGRWELARLQMMFGGGRRVWLRRRIMRVERTF